LCGMGRPWTLVVEPVLGFVGFCCPPGASACAGWSSVGWLSVVGCRLWNALRFTRYYLPFAESLGPSLGSIALSDVMLPPHTSGCCGPLTHVPIMRLIPDLPLVLSCVKEALHVKAQWGGPQALREREVINRRNRRNRLARRRHGQICPTAPKRLQAPKPHSPKAQLPKRSWHDGPPSRNASSTLHTVHTVHRGWCEWAVGRPAGLWLGCPAGLAPGRPSVLVARKVLGLIPRARTGQGGAAARGGWRV
jgi:hypothetical protein